MTYTAKATHKGQTFTGTGSNDHAAVTAALAALRADHHAENHEIELSVWTFNSCAYATTATRYFIDTN
jgi:hypothetical protein